MRMNKPWLTGIGIAAIAVVLGSWQYFPKVPVPAASVAALDIATSSVPNKVPVPAQTAPKAPATASFPINSADAIASWNFKGAYTGNAALTAQAESDSAKLTGLLGTKQYNDYDLYIGLGNDYNLIGDGKNAYDNYNHAIALYPNNQGLAYVNQAHLMDELGAYHTAADAYAKATAVEPGSLEYHVERLTYLTRQFPKDTALVAAALSDANKQFGDNASILAIEARWLSEQGRYADAIKAWQIVKMLSPGKDTTAVDAEIARLQAKQ